MVVIAEQLPELGAYVGGFSEVGKEASALCLWQAGGLGEEPFDASPIPHVHLGKRDGITSDRVARRFELNIFSYSVSSAWAKPRLSECETIPPLPFKKTCRVGVAR